MCPPHINSPKGRRDMTSLAVLASRAKITGRKQNLEALGVHKSWTARAGRNLRECQVLPSHFQERK